MNLEENWSSHNTDNQVSRTWEENEELSYFKVKRKPWAAVLHFFSEVIKMVKSKTTCRYRDEHKERGDTVSVEEGYDWHISKGYFKEYMIVWISGNSLTQPAWI